jgi:transcriptional regulator with XRE-family HTH domain
LEEIKSFGELFKSLRKRSGKTLSQLGHEIKQDPGNLSRMERGLAAPSQKKAKLADWAKALGLQSGSGDWARFFDLAAIEAGRIPDEIMENREILDKLPLLFQAVRMNNIPWEKMGEAPLENSRRSVVRVRRLSDPETQEAAGPESSLETMWRLSRDTSAFMRLNHDEPGLQRHVVRLVRGKN